MTIAEYIDPQRFPEATQKGLTPHQQMMIDALNYDDVIRDREEGKAIPADSRAVVAELEEKHMARPKVAAELKNKG